MPTLRKDGKWNLGNTFPYKQDALLVITIFHTCLHMRLKGNEIKCKGISWTLIPNYTVWALILHIQTQSRTVMN